MNNIQRISNLKNQLNWFQLFFLKFPLKGMLEVSSYFILAVCSGLLAVYYCLWQESTWKFVILAILMILFVFFLIMRGKKYEKVVLDKLCVLNQAYFNDGCERNKYNLRVAIVKRELKECNFLSKEIIDELISIFSAEAMVPRYDFKALKIFNAVLLIILGSSIALLFRSDGKEEVKDILSLFRTSSGLIFGIAALVLGIEVLLVRGVYNFVIKQHYRVHLIRFLNEIKLNM